MPAPAWVTLTFVPTLGLIVTNIMWSSPLKVMIECRRSRDLGTMNPLPAVAVIFNCIGWTIYGLMKRDYFLWFANVPGICIGLFSTVTAMSIISQNTKPFEKLPEQYTQIEFLLVFAFFFWCLIALVGVNAFVYFPDSLAQAENMVGIISSCFAICYYAAPLSTLVEVVRTKDASTLYAPMILVNFVNSFLWTTYGFALLDANLIVPNALGMLLSLCQVTILYMYYKKPVTEEEKRRQSLASSVESKVPVNPIRNEHFDDYLNEDGAGAGVMENFSKSSKELFHVGR